MNQKLRRTITAAVVTTALALGLTACVSSLAATTATLPSPTPSSPCNGPKPAITSKTPTVAILGQTGPGISYYQPDINTVVTAATDEQARVVVNGIGNPSTAPDLVTDEVLTGTGPNGALRTQNLKCKTRLVNTSASKTIENVPAVTQPDVFSALDVLAGNLQGNPSTQPVDVVLLASLVANGGGVDLGNPATLANPIAAINKLAAASLIPSCKGDRIYAVGADRGLSDTQTAQLKEFWRQYAQKCGGQLVAWTDHLAQFPVSEALSAADTSQIPVQHLPGRIVATLAGDVTFATGTSDLQPAAQNELQQVYALIPKGSLPVAVDGYTDDTGSDAINKPLSTARAEAVVRWLEQHGVAQGRLTPHGHGSDDPAKPNTSDANRQANRRVTVTISTAKS